MIKLCAPTDEAGSTLEQAIKNMRYGGVYLAEIRDIDGKNVLDLTSEEATNYYHKLKENNITVWAISSPIGKRDFHTSFEEFKNRVSKAILMAQCFKTNRIRVFSFFDHNHNKEEVVKRLNYVVSEAKKYQIQVCLENEKGCYGETADTIKELLSAVPNLGFVYDSANFIQVHELASKTIEEVLPLATYIHFKDGIYKNNDAEITPVGEGEADILSLLCNLPLNKDYILSIEHHLRFAKPGEGYEQIKDEAKFVYPNISEAFIDALFHAKKALSKTGYLEIHEGIFKRSNI